MVHVIQLVMGHPANLTRVAAAPTLDPKHLLALRVVHHNAQYTWEHAAWHTIRILHAWGGGKGDETWVMYGCRQGDGT